MDVLGSLRTLVGPCRHVGREVVSFCVQRDPQCAIGEVDLKAKAKSLSRIENARADALFTYGQLSGVAMLLVNDIVWDAHTFDPSRCCSGPQGPGYLA